MALRAAAAVKPMRLFEESEVRALYRACHPGWPEKPPQWHVAHPTLVLAVQGEVIGWTAFSVGPPPGQNVLEPEVMYGHGVYVGLSYRGNGFGRELVHARLDIARAIGCRTLIGMTQPGNAPMIRLFEEDGFKPFGEQADAYPDGSTGVIYIGAP